MYQVRIRRANSFFRGPKEQKRVVQKLSKQFWNWPLSQIIDVFNETLQALPVDCDDHKTEEHKVGESILDTISILHQQNMKRYHPLKVGLMAIAWDLLTALPARQAQEKYGFRPRLFPKIKEVKSMIQKGDMRFLTPEKRSKSERWTDLYKKVITFYDDQ